MPSEVSYNTNEVEKGSAAEVAAAISHAGAVYPSNWERFAPYIGEYVGVFILTTTFLFNSSQLKLSQENESWALNSNGFMMCALVYALGHISGGHLNPSVSISLALTGRLPGSTTAKLVTAQIFGGASAALLRMQFTNATAELEPLHDHSWRAVVSVEILFTALVCFVYLNCASSLRNNPLAQPNGFAGLCVGLCFIAGAWATRDVSHGVMNSAIAVGLGIVEGGSANTVNSNVHRALIYICTDFAGAFIGTGLYRVVRPDEASRQNSDRKTAVDRRRQIGTRIAAEFIGTFFLILVKALNRLAMIEVSMAGLGPESWSVMAVITALVYSLSSVSGAYFNPALTIGAWACGQGAWCGYDWIFYLLAQTFGAIGASSVFVALSNGRSIPYADSTFGTGVEALSEGMFSGFLTFVVLSTRVGLKTSSEEAAGGAEDVKAHLQGNFHGLAYGACHVAGGFSIGPITGSMINPAVVLSFVGVDLLHGNFGGGFACYVFYQVAGSLVGAAFFVLLHAELYREEDPQKAEAEKRDAANLLDRSGC